ncbi:putative tail fiber protein [Rhizobium phage RHEph16]|uniref:Tail fiber protein n=1 Tax=Rhizobium phage RHEph16 TaxID=2836132 RepID=A0AAE8AWN0_9CAUD|nr:minor tail protein [Rhizobium phage RHEph16]QXV74392.1 putative tail fiber protein [Rhizobium phage RHEph16]
MAGLPPFATGTPELTIGTLILQTSYDVVKFVAQNLDAILAVEGATANVAAIVGHLDEIAAIAPKINEISELSDNIEAVAAVAANVEQILNIYDDLTTIVNAATQTAADSAAAIAAKNAAEDIRDNLISGLNVLGNILSPGSDPTISYDPNLKRITFGLPRPAVTNLSIGTVSSGTVAAANITGDPLNRILDLTLPTGNNAWSPVFAVVANGSAMAQKVVDWVGGTGVKPAINVYVGATGFVSNINDAVNVRGPAGAGTGDMLISIYDPTGKNGDAFLMTNMVEGTTNKIFTATERTKLSGIEDGATANDTDANLRDRTTHTGSQAQSTITNLVSDLAAKVDSSSVGANNGVAPLDGTGKVPVANLPGSVLGGVSYQGTWDAAANTPAIPAASAGNKGYYYKVATAGTTSISGIAEWAIGDWIVSNGTSWEKVDNSEAVTSVAGKVGNVSLDKNDVGLGNVANKSEAQMVASGAIADALDAKASASQGALADTALQPADVGTISTANILTGTADPSGGVDGDIYFQYDA